MESNEKFLNLLIDLKIYLQELDSLINVLLSSMDNDDMPPHYEDVIDTIGIARQKIVNARKIADRMDV